MVAVSESWIVQVVIGPTVTSNGVEYLTCLQDLKAISFDSLNSHPIALNAVSRLTGLVAAEVSKIKSFPRCCLT